MKRFSFPKLTKLLAWTMDSVIESDLDYDHATPSMPDGMNLPENKILSNQRMVIINYLIFPDVFLELLDLIVLTASYKCWKGRDLDPLPT